MGITHNHRWLKPQMQKLEGSCKIFGVKAWPHVSCCVLSVLPVHLPLNHLPLAPIIEADALCIKDRLVSASACTGWMRGVWARA